LDIGSGAPLVLPDSFGTPSAPHLLMVVGKEGTFYLVKRDHFGGFQQGGAGSCPDGSGHAGDDIVSTFRLPDSPVGVWATPAAWQGEGGLIYVPYPAFFGGPGKFTAYRITPDGNGTPQLSVAGQSNDDPFGYGSSSAIITSDGTTSGTGLAWVVWFPDSSGVGAELRAYDANPASGVLTLRGRWPVGQGNKFTTPTVNAGRVYVGTRDGHVVAFGVPEQFGVKQAPAPSAPARAPKATHQDVPDAEG
jgi:iron transport multicopper oxidase